MLLKIARGDSTDEGTFGVATLGGKTYVSLELPDRDNAEGVSRIPSGTYKTERIYSAHFNRRVFRLLDVPGRSEIEIHPANWAGDTEKDWHSDLRGCITLGMQRASIQNPEGRMQAAVLKSTIAIDALDAAVGDDALDVEIS